MKRFWEYTSTYLRRGCAYNIKSIEYSVPGANNRYTQEIDLHVAYESYNTGKLELKCQLSYPYMGSDYESHEHFIQQNTLLYFLLLSFNVFLHAVS